MTGNSMHYPALFLVQPVKSQFLATVALVMGHIPRPVIIILLIAGLGGLYWLQRRFRRQPRINLPPAFRDQPHQFDQRWLELTGRVEHVFEEDSRLERPKRWVTDAWRDLTGSNDHTNRHMHQRFLVSAAGLAEGAVIKVDHNESFGKIRGLTEGASIALRGEYIHKPPPGKKYGLIHHTHPGGSGQKGGYARII
jgi:hypothetical protein